MPTSGRGTRGGGRTVSEATRGGRGRGGRAGGRGGRDTAGAPPRESSNAPLSVPTSESTAWDTAAATATSNEPSAETPFVGESQANSAPSSSNTASNATSAPAARASNDKPTAGGNKTWASMFAAPKPASSPAAAKPKSASVRDSTPLAAENKTVVHETQPEVHPEVAQTAAPQLEFTAQSDVLPPNGDLGLEAALAPPKDPLTEDNLEHVPDNSHPPATMTAASTVGSAAATPLGSNAGRILGGYPSSALRGTMPNRAPSYQRRVLDQQEAVVMPGHNAVDRAAVQFGSMGLNGQSEGPDVDQDREGPETRSQPLQSPPQAPRASLPQTSSRPQQTDTQTSGSYGQQGLPTPKQAPGLMQQHQQSSQQSVASQQLPGSSMLSKQDSTPQSSQSYLQQSRYDQHDSAPQSQRPYDPFGSSAPTASAQYGQHQQPQQQHQHQQPQPQQQQQGYPSGYGYGSNNAYSQYYSADQQRGGYQSQYGQAAQGQQENAMQQRTGSSLGAGASEGGYPSSQSTQPVCLSGSNMRDYADMTVPVALRRCVWLQPDPSDTWQSRPAAECADAPAVLTAAWLWQLSLWTSILQQPLPDGISVPIWLRSGWTSVHAVWNQIERHVRSAWLRSTVIIRSERVDCGGCVQPALDHAVARLGSVRRPG